MSATAFHLRSFANPHLRTSQRMGCCASGANVVAMGEEKPWVRRWTLEASETTVRGLQTINPNSRSPYLSPSFPLSASTLTSQSRLYAGGRAPASAFFVKPRESVNSPTRDTRVSSLPGRCLSVRHPSYARRTFTLGTSPPLFVFVGARIHPLMISQPLYTSQLDDHPARA